MIQQQIQAHALESTLCVYLCQIWSTLFLGLYLWSKTSITGQSPQLFCVISINCHALPTCLYCMPGMQEHTSVGLFVSAGCQFFHIYLYIRTGKHVFHLSYKNVITCRYLTNGISKEVEELCFIRVISEKTPPICWCVALLCDSSSNPLSSTWPGFTFKAVILIHIKHYVCSSVIATVGLLVY